MRILSHVRNEMPQVTARTLIAVLLGLTATPGLAADDGPAVRAISEILGGFVKPGEPGCTVGVTENGMLSHALAFGMSDVERGRPLDTHSTFDLASVSKQFTAFALLLLQQQGKLSLDDPLVKYMPELVASGKGVTLRHLVHHTGGLRDYIDLIVMGGRTYADGSTIHEAVQALARQTRPNAEPGVEYEYSNTGYFLLGVVIARVSGQSLAQFADEQIFRPLGMVNTRIVDRYPDGNATRARGYANSGKGFVVDESGWEQVGDGGVHSDLHDLALWDENFYTAKLGGRAVIDEMYKVGVLRSGEPIDYAGGLRIGVNRGVRTISHSGGWVGYASYLLRMPVAHLSVIVLCNRGDANTEDLANRVAEVFLTDKLSPATADADDEAVEDKLAAPGWQPRDLARYTGTYYSAEAVAQCRIHLQNDRLIVEGCAEGAVLRPGKAGEFTDADESFTLRFPANGSDNGSFVYNTFGLRDLPFTRVAEQFE
ncbi:MAG: class A beta-lactamase-related serine hydrolase [Gammaproteobacteria bacterium]|nr:class A beta-lactamase-related serine hydrolase [Gammaproteobacteria bacterium]